MYEVIETMITFACAHPALIGLISLVWGVLAGWTARIAWEAIWDEDAAETQEWLKEVARR